jgi:hypothetical protein
VIKKHKTIATGPVSGITVETITISALHNRGKHNGNKNKETNAVNGKVVMRKPIKVMTVTGKSSYLLRANSVGQIHVRVYTCIKELTFPRILESIS